MSEGSGRSPSMTLSHGINSRTRPGVTGARLFRCPLAPGGVVSKGAAFRQGSALITVSRVIRLLWLTRLPRTRFGGFSMGRQTRRDFNRKMLDSLLAYGLIETLFARDLL